jgi:hypothetical protein
MKLDRSTMAKKWKAEIPHGKGHTVSETKETGSQSLGSKPYQYKFLYRRFIHSFFLPTQSTKFWNNYCITSISKDQILSQTNSFYMMPTLTFVKNTLPESNFWTKTIRLTNAGTYYITHWSGRMWPSTSLKLKRISLQESYIRLHEESQSNVITVLKQLPERDCQQCSIHGEDVIKARR